MATKTAKDIEIEINGLTDAQAALLTWVDIDDEYIKKDPSKRDWWDKAFGNSNPELKEKNKLYREYANSIADLKSRLTNLKSAEQYMTDIVSENKDRINKIYDLQNKAAALSAWIQWTNRVAWWLWAASNVLNNSQWLTDATLRQSVAQNEAARQTALLNNAQQALNIPSTLASIWQANAQIAYQNALTWQLNNQWSWWSWGWGWYSYWSWYNIPKKDWYSALSNADLKDVASDKYIKDSLRKQWLAALQWRDEELTLDDMAKTKKWKSLIARIDKIYEYKKPWNYVIWWRTYTYVPVKNWIQDVYLS